jgi:hypothetical protein
MKATHPNLEAVRRKLRAPWWDARRAALGDAPAADALTQDVVNALLEEVRAEAASAADSDAPDPARRHPFCSA